jgi:hypothetical protein
MMASGAITAAEDDGGGQPDAGLARMLLRIVLNDPGHLPENLAGFSLKMLAPGVPAYVARMREENPDADSVALEHVIARRGLREASGEGGFVGGPFIVFIPVAFVAALLAQIKMLLRMAAVSGRDPCDPRRAAEVLVIMGVYGTVDQAAAAMEALPDAGDGAVGRHSAVFAVWGVIWRMAKLLGLVAPAAVNPVSRLVHLGRWLLLGLALVVGMVAPMIWLPYLAMSYYRGTVELAERTSAFYGGKARAIHLPRKTSAVPGLVAALLRAIASLVLIGVGVATFLALDVRIDGHEWPALLLLAILVSSATGLAWYLRHARHLHGKATP